MYKRCGIFFVAIVILFELSFAQEKSGFDLEKIIISKDKVYLLRPFSLKSAKLKELAVDSVIEALGSLPIDLQSRSPKGAIQTDFSLRGSNFQEVLILFQGQRINDPQTAHHNSDIPVTKEDVERVDMLAGVSSAVYGSDSISGALNFVLKKPDERKIVFESSGGQYKTWSGLFSVSEKTNDFGARVSVENQNSAGFDTDTDFRKFTSTFSSSLDVPNGEFDLDFGYQEKEFGAYDFYTPESGYQSKEWTKTYLLNTGLVLEKDGLLIKPNFLWRRHYDKFLLDKTLIRSRYLNHSRTNMFTPNFYFQKDIGFIGKAGLGFEYGYENINSVFLGKHNRSHISVFMDDSKEISQNLSLGMSFRAEDFSETETAYTGSVSAKYNLCENKIVRFGISRSTRIPSFTELFYNDPTTVGNPALSNESSVNYQASFEYRINKVTFSPGIFFRQEEDSIDWVKRTPFQPMWQAENIDSGKVFGSENRLKIDFNEYFCLDSNYTFINKQTSKAGFIYKYGPNYAKHLLNSELLIKLPFGTQSVGFAFKKKPDRRGWFLMNARLNYKLNKQSSVFINATNLLNVEYQEIEGIPQPGRWVEGGFRIEW